MLKKSRKKREDDANDVIEKIKQYCEDRLLEFRVEETHLVMAAYRCVIDILRIINPDDDVIGRIRKIG